MTEAKTEVLTIPGCDAFDPITVFWRNWQSGKGELTVICWGMAWTAYFGAMMGETIQQFVATADTYYLVNKLMDRQWQKQTKAHENYLTRIVEAIKKALISEQGDREDGK